MKGDCFTLMKKFIPQEFWEDLMFMGWSKEIALYKHISTRLYVNVDKDGRFYKYNVNGYEEIEKGVALRHIVG